MRKIMDSDDAAYNGFLTRLRSKGATAVGAAHLVRTLSSDHRTTPRQTIGLPETNAARCQYQRKV